MAIMPDKRIETSPEERQVEILRVLREKGVLTVTGAWDVGYEFKFYIGGDAMMAKRDLMALVQRNQAVYHEGFWRTGDPKSRCWSDYWTPKGRG